MLELINGLLRFFGTKLIKFENRWRIIHRKTAPLWESPVKERRVVAWNKYYLLNVVMPKGTIYDVKRVHLPSMSCTVCITYDVDGQKYFEEVDGHLQSLMSIPQEESKPFPLNEQLTQQVLGEYLTTRVSAYKDDVNPLERFCQSIDRTLPQMWSGVPGHYSRLDAIIIDRSVYRAHSLAGYQELVLESEVTRPVRFTVDGQMEYGADEISLADGWSVAEYRWTHNELILANHSTMQAFAMPNVKAYRIGRANEPVKKVVLSEGWEIELGANGKVVAEGSGSVTFEIKRGEDGKIVDVDTVKDPVVALDGLQVDKRFDTDGRCEPVGIKDGTVNLYGLLTDTVVDNQRAWDQLDRQPPFTEWLRFGEFEVAFDIMDLPVGMGVGAPILALGINPAYPKDMLSVAFSPTISRNGAVAVLPKQLGFYPVTDIRWKGELGEPTSSNAPQATAVDAGWRYTAKDRFAPEGGKLVKVELVRPPRNGKHVLLLTYTVTDGASVSFVKRLVAADNVTRNGSQNRPNRGKASRKRGLGKVRK